MGTRMQRLSETPPVAPTLAVGCPVWNCPAWVGAVYRGNQRREWLGDYSRMFPTVEGNSTFYALPSRETVQRWADETAPGFRFCFKFPKTVSHLHQLEGCDRQVREFFDRLEILRRSDRLGPSFLQLPPSFSGNKLPRLGRFLDQYAGEFPLAVEVRHGDFFDGGPHEETLCQLLAQHRVDYVIFDSRPLHALPPRDEYEEASQGRKPKIPHRQTVTGSTPFLRLVGRNRLEETIDGIEGWVPAIASWIERGLRPMVFMHTPNEAHAPATARYLYERIRDVFPHWPELPGPPSVELPPASARQRQLFEI